MEFITGVKEREYKSVSDILSGDFEGKEIAMEGAVHTVRDDSLVFSLNILSMIATLLVSKLVNFRTRKLGQFANMDDMFVVFSVTKFERSSMETLYTPLNICDIFVTCAVLNFEVSISVMAEQSANI